MFNKAKRNGDGDKNKEAYCGQLAIKEGAENVNFLARVVSQFLSFEIFEIKVDESVVEELFLFQSTSKTNGSEKQVTEHWLWALIPINVATCDAEAATVSGPNTELLNWIAWGRPEGVVSSVDSTKEDERRYDHDDMIFSSLAPCKCSCSGLRCK